MLLRDVGDEARIVAHRHDLRRVAHDAGILHQSVPKLLGLQRKPARLERQKCLLEAGPFRLDHAPGKPRAEHALGHFRQNAVIAKPGQRLGIRFRRQQALERIGTALALLGARPDLAEFHHDAFPCAA